MKMVQLDFPWYDGKDDPITWLRRINKYFQFHDIAESNKVILRSFYLEEDALLLYQILEQETLYVTWVDFRDKLFSQFGPNQFEDWFSELTKLC